MKSKPQKRNIQQHYVPAGYEVSAEIPLRLRKSMLSQRFVDFAEPFAEDWNVVPWYGMFARADQQQ
jgi:hypothetical protein